MATLTKKFEAQLERLIAEGDALVAGASRSAAPAPDDMIAMAFHTDLEYVDGARYCGWKPQVEAALAKALGAESPFLRRFQEEEQGHLVGAVKLQVGVLRGALDAVRHGELSSLASLIVAEVFSDFLEMADHLQRAGHHVAAASLCGAVLEDSLRRLCDAHGIAYNKRDGLDVLNKKLATASPPVYHAFTKSSIDAWRGLRNDADHGHFAKVNPADVKMMLDGVRKLMSDHANELATS
jgi:hypothetical protein